jgi:hypothetical protein
MSKWLCKLCKAINADGAIRCHSCGRELGLCLTTSQQFDHEEFEDNAKIKKDLKKATRGDFSIVGRDGDFAYAVALYGCYDIATFRRKADAEKFINTFAQQATVPKEE